jgi:HicB family
MKMSLVVDGLRSDVVAVGELGDDVVAELAERIADVLARSAPVRVLDLLSDAATEVSAELPEGRVELRVAGDDVQLAYVEDEHVAGDVDDDGQLPARITLRLSEALKARVEEGAAAQGMSVNSYIVRALGRGASTSRNYRSRGGTRLRGYGST